ncbi:MAG TPA: HD domain-containing phosphohydrolase [Candidatus Sumerlaeota bacterium]|nr:HD domain-containing phosphohydrolase [Candidatus Sumerlaeota bacterium]
MESFQRQVHHLTEIGIALSGELNLDALLQKTLGFARELTLADAGTLYLIEDNLLQFKILQNDTLQIYKGGATGEPITLDPVRMEKTNVSAYAALLRQTVRVEDVYDEHDEFDFSGPRRYDALTGYHSRSMLVVPMKDHEDEVIGVLQLINALKPGTREVIGFSDESVNLAEALASQAAVAISNANLIEETRNLFESLIQVLATATDQKSHYTGNHIQRVAEFNVFLAQAINDKTDGPFANVHFSARELDEIRIAGWLHDVGKITTPEWVMDKATKLEGIFDRAELIRERFENKRLRLELERLKRQSPSDVTPEETEAAEREYAEKLQGLEADLEFVLACNQPSQRMDPGAVERLSTIAHQMVEERDGPHALLTDSELHNLSVSRGTLTGEQMAIMRDHVTTTAKMLAQVPFRHHLKNVPRYAAQHHERLNGTGYPLGLKSDQIPLQSRILAIADFYEALAAKDRPYKKALPEEKLLEILQAASNAGEIDPDILQLLTEDKVHRQFEAEYETRKSQKKDASAS